MFSRIFTIARVVRMLRTMRTHEGWPENQLALHQERELAVLRHFASTASPFYRDFHGGLENAPLAELPVLTKTLMMENFDRFATDRRVRLTDVRDHVVGGSVGRFRSRYEVVTTSGTTGQPGIFLFDPAEWATIIASFARAREWAGVKLDFTRRSRMAVVSSTNQRNLSARVGAVADTPFIPTLRLDATEPVPAIVAALNRWQPEALVAYASMAYFLAAEQLGGTLRIRPHVVFTSSEVLTAQMRERLVEAWGDVVFDEYASTETATIAAEDVSHHGMHIFEDLLIVENVDSENRPVPAGSFGEKILVTVLFSRTQPLIRYEISDSVRFRQELPDCRLPFLVMDGIQGRTEDTLILRGRSGASVAVHPNVFHDVMDAILNKGWQVVQGANGLTVLIVPLSTLDADAVRAEISATLARRGVAELAVEIQIVGAIPKSPSGKSPLIKAFKPIAGPWG